MAKVTENLSKFEKMDIRMNVLRTAYDNALWQVKFYYMDRAEDGENDYVAPADKERLDKYKYAMSILEELEELL